MASSSHSDSLTAAIRTAAANPTTRSAFIAEKAKQAKELQRNNIQEYDITLSSLLMCLESFDVVQGDPTEVLCELTVLGILFSLDLSAFQLSQCNSYLHLCLKAVSTSVVAVAAAKTFAETLGRSMATDFVRTQADDALDWIALTASEAQPRRLAGLLVLTEVALRAPMIILPKLGEVLDKLWGALASGDAEVRARGLRLMSLGMKLLGDRPASVRLEIYDATVRQLRAHLTARATERRTIGLLAFEPILANSASYSTPAMLDHIAELLKPYLPSSSNGSSSNSNNNSGSSLEAEVVRSPELCRLLFRSLVVLARHHTQSFVAHYLADTMRLTLRAVRRAELRVAALDTISDTVPLVGAEAFAPYVHDTCEMISTVVATVTTPCWEALRCFAVVCRVCQPPEMERYVDGSTEHIFAWGISAQLIECMRVIIAYASESYRSRLEESLLDMISVTLCGLPFRQQLGNLRRLPTPGTSIDPSDYQISVALSALMQFGFSNTELMSDFLRDSVLPFIDHGSAMVRNAAIFTIVKLLIPPGNKGDLSVARRLCIDTVIARMLVVGVSHANADVRQTILSSFTADFYPYLSEKQFLTRFYCALGDESINCRVAALEQLALMIHYSPSHILSALREQMVLILRLIEPSYNLGTTTDGLQLLTALTTNAPFFVVNFIDGIFDALRPHCATMTASSPLLLPFLHCCRAVADAVQRFEVADVDFSLLIVLVCHLLDTLPMDRAYHAARLSCLRFLSATLRPIMQGESPYKRYPRLFRQLVAILRRGDDNLDIRLEALRCVGVVGALDAHVFQLLGIDGGDRAIDDGAVVVTSVTPQKCGMVVLGAIADLLSVGDKRLTTTREAVLRTSTRTILDIAELSPSSRSELRLVVGPLARAIVELGAGRLLASSLYDFTNIVKLVGAAVAKDVDALFAIVYKVWDQFPDYRFLVVRLLSIMLGSEVTLDAHAVQHHSRILPLVFDFVSHTEATTDVQFAVFGFMLQHGEALQGCCEQAVNCLLTIISARTSATELAYAAVVTLRVLCAQLYVDELVGPIQRSLVARLATALSQRRYDPYNEPLIHAILGLFSALLAEMQADFAKYVTDIAQLLKAHRRTNTEFWWLASKVVGGECAVRLAKTLQAERAEAAALLKRCDAVMFKAMSRVGDAWVYTSVTDNNSNSGGDTTGSYIYGSARFDGTAPLLSAAATSVTAVAGPAATGSSSNGGSNMDANFADEKALPINEARLLAVIKTVPVTREEWVKLSDQFTLLSLQESPFQVFRCISMPTGVNATPLVERAPQLARDVLQVAFRAMWTYASAALRCAFEDFLRQSFRQAMTTASSIPDDVLIALLSIVEYMDHAGETLAIAPKEISDCAWSRGMLAKALYWREAAYRLDPATTVESLISLYSELHMVNSAVGILTLAEPEQRRALLQGNLIKLARYTEALQMTQQEIEHDKDLADGAASGTGGGGGGGSSSSAAEAGAMSGSEVTPRQATGAAVATRASVMPLQSPSCAYGSRNWPRMLHYRTNSDNVFGSFARPGTGEEAAVGSTMSERRWSSYVRLMLCLSELGDYKQVLREWNTMYDKFGYYNSSGGGGVATAGGGQHARVTSSNESNVSGEGDDGNILSYVAQHAADASIRLQSYDTLARVLPWLPRNTVQYCIAQAVLRIVHGEYADARSALHDGRTLLLEDLSGLLHESYNRAYESLIVAQQLTELEEVITAKCAEKAFATTEHLPIVSRLWEQRIRMMAPTVLAWKQVLSTRTLLVAPAQDVRTRIRFLKLCRQEHAVQLEKFTLDELLGSDDPSYDELTSWAADPRVVMQYITYLSTNHRFGPDSTFGQESDFIKTVINVHSRDENALVLARAYVRLGAKVGLPESVQYFKAATVKDPSWYIAWRLWAEVNAELLAKEAYTHEACSNAIDGYIHSIQLGTSDSTIIQDVLKLLTLWSRHCDQERGLQALRSRVFGVPSRVWHLVVPQLIARLDSGSDESCHLVADVVLGVAYDYPHTLMYPLNLCTTSDSERRTRWAEGILGKLQARYPVLVAEGRRMIYELVRISSLIYERWYDKLELAATAFFGRHSPHDMLRTLLPIHDTLDAVPETIVEADFMFRFRASLAMAKDWLRSYSTTRNIADLHSAWNLYHTVYKSIDEHMKATDVLSMQFCSPVLFEARDLAIGIPDARPVREESVSMIACFQDDLLVIASKQRPKRIGLITAEGRTQKFLLKGREDLRLDERVMQLFALVNILMLSDSRSGKNGGFQIQRYSVTPLKDVAGLIGWVDGCDTLHELVRYYRDRRSIPTELEMRMLGQIITLDNVKAYDYLSSMSKVEVMEFLAERTSGLDIRKAMWAAVPSCEAWLEQRHMYTTSLANMSVVGYILGLGDRHPNNIMVQRATGLVVHIDFGDCFEVAMTREKFPEKVPFRLTRMLRNALDVSGVDGAFRSNAETAMSVMRENSHSVLALLEAFLQDPLISWRLVNRPGQAPESSNEHKAIEEQIKMANQRSQILGQAPDSVSGSLEAGGRREAESQSVVKYLFGEEVDVVHQGVLILKRLSSKLEGMDFITPTGPPILDAPTQVHRLIEEATDITNVAQSWSGWYPFW